MSSTEPTIIHFSYHTRACKWKRTKLLDFLTLCGRSFHSKDKDKTDRNLAILSMLLDNAAKSLMMNLPLQWANFTFLKGHPLGKELTVRKRTTLAQKLQSEGYLTRLSSGFSVGSKVSLSTWQVEPKILSFWEGNDVQALLDQYPPVEERFPKDERRRIYIPEGYYKGQRFNDHQILTEANRMFLERINLPATPFVRSYQANGKLSGRVYTSIQQQTKHSRGEWLRIDGEKVSEPDFEASHLNLISRLYFGDCLNYDPYVVHDDDGNLLDRDDVKRVTQCLLNAKRPKTVFTGPKSEYKWTSEKFDLYRKAIVKRNPFIADFIGTGYGMVAQWIEGEIAMALIQRFTRKGEVIIPVHDSYLCREGIAQEVKQAMQEERERIVKSLDPMELLSRVKGSIPSQQSVTVHSVNPVQHVVQLPPELEMIPDDPTFPYNLHKMKVAAMEGSKALQRVMPIGFDMFSLKDNSHFSIYADLLDYAIKVDAGAI